MSLILQNEDAINPQIHVGDFGTQFIATIYNQDETIVNLATAISLTFRFKSPSNVTVDKTASLYMGGTTGKMVYILESDTFLEAGRWKYQGIIEFASGTWNTNIETFMVYPNLAVPTP